MNIVLIGYRGTGKSTVAKLLAERLHWTCVDSDSRIERRTGKTVSEIFALRGEQAFRDQESEVVAELAGQDRLVLALGGGAVLREENRRAIAESGWVIWLQAEPETIQARIEADALGRRPDLTPLGGAEEIVQLLRERSKIYSQCANHQVDTEGKTPDEIANTILSLWESDG